MKPQFVCGYQGASDYSWKGKTYVVRSSADDWRPGVWNYTPEDYLRERVALVGTILNYCGNGEFPPVELEAFFTGYVRARFNQTTWVVEYAGNPPITVHSDVYRATLSAASHAEFVANGWDV